MKRRNEDMKSWKGLSVLAGLLLFSLTAASGLAPARADDPKSTGLSDAEAASGSRELTWVFLESGGNRKVLPAQEAAEMQTAHLANLTRLGEIGKNLMAGPLGGGGRVRGIVVLDLEEGEELLSHFDGDPFVEHDYLKVRPHRWIPRFGRLEKPSTPRVMGEYTLALVRTATASVSERDGSGEESSTSATQDAYRQLEASVVSAAGGRGQERESPSVLAMAGPVVGSDSLLGILLFRTKNERRVRSLFRAVPGWEEGKLSLELHTMYVLKGILDGVRD